MTAGPREYLKIKYSAPTGACKCGNCQLVPPDVLAAWAEQLEAKPSSSSQFSGGTCSGGENV